MSNALKSQTLKVPGAKIYYETRGSGPVLLMIPGGPTDAGVFAGLGESLADRYTVVPYDPRGNSRSVFDGVPEEQNMDVHGDDAARLIEALGGGPAFVLGSSGGAQIGLNLAARHPERVRAVVAHEPPCIRLLTDSKVDLIAGTEAVYDAYRREGTGAAMQKFAELAGLSGPPPMDAGAEMPPEVMQTFGRIAGNMEYFFAHGFRPISLYLPDVAALRGGPARVAVGIGETSAGQLAYRTGVALAAKLGIEPVTFPGDHGGFGPHAAAFGKILHRIFNSQHQETEA